MLIGPAIALRQSGGLLAETIALVAAMSTPPTAARVPVINTLIGSLQAAGVWSRLASLWVFAAETEQASLLDWKNPATAARAFAKVSTPTFEADRGWTGNGSTAYLSTTATIDTMSPFALNSAHAGVWSSTVGQNATTEIANAASTTLRITMRSAGDLLVGRLTAASNSSAANTAVGHAVINRTASNALQLYMNGASIGTASQASTAVPADALRAAVNTRRQLAVHLGSSLGAGEVAALYAAVLVYKTAVGA